MITPYHIAILTAVATYYALTRKQIQALCCPNDKDGRATRKRLLQLVQMGLLGKTRMEVVNPRTTDGPMPVYHITQKGKELLAGHTGSDVWLDVCAVPPQWTTLFHTVVISQFHILLRQAVELQSVASLAGWLGEYDVINPKGKSPEERYRLYTLIREKPKRLVCNPDAAFLLPAGEYRRIFYLELDRETTGHNALAHSKTPGYAELAEKQLHKRHFESSNTDDFWVLSVSYTPGRRDLVRRAVKDRPLAERWKFSCWADLSPQTLLFGHVWYLTEGVGGPLVKTANSPVPVANPGSAGGPGGVPGVARPGPAADQTSQVKA